MITKQKRASSLPGSLAGLIKLNPTKTFLSTVETQPAFFPDSLPFQITPVPGSGSGVTSVIATEPLENTGSADTVNIALTGVVDISHGGTHSGTPLNGNRAMISASDAIVESNASTTSQVLVGGSPPSFGSVPADALPFTFPLSRENGGFGSDVSGLRVGYAVQTSSDTWAARTLKPGTNVTVTNGTGAAGDSVFDLPDNIALNKEVNHTISVSDSTTNNTAGGNLTTHAAAGFGSGIGGINTVRGGTGGATGAGGAAALTGGAGGSTSGTGGAVSVTGGAATAGNSTGGAASLNGGVGSGANRGGSATMRGGVGGATGSGGNITLSAGASGASGGSGGSINLAAGNATNGSNGSGGPIDIRAGSGSGSGNGAQINIVAGGGGLTGAAGSMALYAGNAGSSTNNDGGNIEIVAGIPGGSGALGNINLGGIGGNYIPANISVGGAGSSVNLGRLTVTQTGALTSGVTINSSSGKITTVSATLAAGASASFTVTNSNVRAGAIVIAIDTEYSSTLVTNGVPKILVGSVVAGSFVVTVTNVGANALSGTIGIVFAVL